MIPPNLSQLEAEPPTGSHASGSHIAAAWSVRSTASLVSPLPTTVLKSLPSPAERRSSEASVPIRIHTSQQSFSLDPRITSGRTEDESTGDVGTGPLNHESLIPGDEGDGHEDSCNPTRKSEPQRLNMVHTGIEPLAGPIPYEQHRKSNNVANTMSKKYQYPSTVLSASLTNEQEREQLSGSTGWIPNWRHFAHSPQVQKTGVLNRTEKTGVLNRTDKSLRNIPTTNDHIRTWYEDMYNGKTLSVFVRPMLYSLNGDLSYGIKVGRSRQYPTKDPYGNLMVVDERKISNKEWYLIVYETAKVLDELGFAYYAVADGFRCIYPWDLAGQITTAAKRTGRVKDQKDTEIACQALHNNRLNVLKEWKAHLESLDHGKRNQYLDVENQFWPDWRAGRIIMWIHFFREKRWRTISDTQKIGFTGHTSDPAAIKHCLARAILHSLPEVVLSDTPSWNASDHIMDNATNVWTAT
jgi:hypothetical protein